MLDKNEHDRDYATQAVSSALVRSVHTVVQHVPMLHHRVSLIAQRPAEDRFVVQIEWQGTPDEPYTIDEDLRSELEAMFLCPVYFAVGVGKSSPLLRLEGPLMTKVDAPAPGGLFEIEKLKPFVAEREPESVIVKSFEYCNDEVCIWLERCDSYHFRFCPRWGDQGIVGDIEVMLRDSTEGMSLNDVKLLPGTIDMAELLQELVESGRWDVGNSALHR